MGHDVPSDPELEPDNCFMTHDEAAILHNCALLLPGAWVDIGSRFGWTTVHIEHAGCDVIAIDPEYNSWNGLKRAQYNISVSRAGKGSIALIGNTSKEFFSGCTDQLQFDGVCIDGNHDSPHPLEDAIGALRHLKPKGFVVFHDFWGKPIRDGAEYLVSQGLKCKTYSTPNGMAVCWRGSVEPPEHVPDSSINWARVWSGRAPECPFVNSNVSIR